MCMCLRMGVPCGQVVEVKKLGDVNGPNSPDKDMRLKAAPRANSLKAGRASSREGLAEYEVLCQYQPSDE